MFLLQRAPLHVLSEVQKGVLIEWIVRGELALAKALLFSAEIDSVLLGGYLLDPYDVFTMRLVKGLREPYQVSAAMSFLQLESVKKFLKLDFSVLRKGESPLHVACRVLNAALIGALLDLGVDANVRDESGLLPMEIPLSYSRGLYSSPHYARLVSSTTAPASPFRVASTETGSVLPLLQFAFSHQAVPYIEKAVDEMSPATIKATYFSPMGSLLSCLLRTAGCCQVTMRCLERCNFCAEELSCIKDVAKQNLELVPKLMQAGAIVTLQDVNAMIGKDHSTCFWMLNQTASESLFNVELTGPIPLLPRIIAKVDPGLAESVILSLLDGLSLHGSDQTKRFVLSGEAVTTNAVGAVCFRRPISPVWHAILVRLLASLRQCGVELDVSSALESLRKCTPDPTTSAMLLQLHAYSSSR